MSILTRPISFQGMAFAPEGKAPGVAGIAAQTPIVGDTQTTAVAPPPTQDTFSCAKRDELHAQIRAQDEKLALVGRNLHRIAHRPYRYSYKELPSDFDLLHEALWQVEGVPFDPVKLFGTDVTFIGVAKGEGDVGRIQDTLASSLRGTSGIEMFIRPNPSDSAGLDAQLTLWPHLFGEEENSHVGELWNLMHAWNHRINVDRLYMPPCSESSLKVLNVVLMLKELISATKAPKISRLSVMLCMSWWNLSCTSLAHDLKKPLSFGSDRVAIGSGSLEQARESFQRNEFPPAGEVNDGYGITILRQTDEDLRGSRIRRASNT